MLALTFISIEEIFLALFIFISNRLQGDARHKRVTETIIACSVTIWTIALLNSSLFISTNFFFGSTTARKKKKNHHWIYTHAMKLPIQSFEAYELIVTLVKTFPYISNGMEHLEMNIKTKLCLYWTVKMVDNKWNKMFQ